MVAIDNMDKIYCENPTTDDQSIQPVSIIKIYQKQTTKFVTRFVNE